MFPKKVEESKWLINWKTNQKDLGMHISIHRIQQKSVHSLSFEISEVEKGAKEIR